MYQRQMLENYEINCGAPTTATRVNGYDMMVVRVTLKTGDLKYR